MEDVDNGAPGPPAGGNLGWSKMTCSKVMTSVKLIACIEILKGELIN